MAQRRVVITGAAGGIGRALVDGFRDANWSVLATDQLMPPVDLGCDRYLQADLIHTVEDAAEAQRCFSEVGAGWTATPSTR